MKLIFTCVALLVALFGFTQAPAYCIYLMSGEVTVSSKGKQPEKAKLNQFLTDNQELKLGNKAQVTLVNKESKYLVLATPGTYPVSGLSQNLKNYPPGVTQKYVSLLWKDLVAAQDNFSSVKRSAASGTLGGVHRGDDCGGLLFPNPNLHASEDIIRFTWKKIPKANGYDLVLLDDQMNELIARQVSDTQAMVNMQKELGRKAGKMYWTVRVKNLPSCEIDPAPFEIFTKEEENKQFGTEAAFLAKEDMIAQLTEIDKLEKDGWVYRAFRCFDILLKANPGNRMLAGQYSMLLLQYGFDKEAEEVMSRGN